MPSVSIIPSLPSADYHAIKALSASMALTIVERCPLVAWTESSFNPDLEIENKPIFDVGTALHLAILEPEQFNERVVMHGFDDYRKTEAREIRDAAYAAGKTPLKPEEHALVLALADSIRATPEISTLLAKPGDAEVSLTWEWDGQPMKARPDFLAADRSFVLDLKSSTSAEPRQVSRKAFTDGWHVRAAWYMAGVKAVTGVLPEHYWFAVCEKNCPYIAQLYELDERALIWGEQLVGRAVNLFAECQKTGVWPKYRQGPSVISLPTWSEHQLADQFEEISAGERDAAARMFAP